MDQCVSFFLFLTENFLHCFKHHLSVLFFLATFSVSIRYSALSSPLCARDFSGHFSSPALSNSLVASPLSLSYR